MSLGIAWGRCGRLFAVIPARPQSGAGYPDVSHDLPTREQALHCDAQHTPEPTDSAFRLPIEDDWRGYPHYPPPLILATTIFFSLIHIDKKKEYGADTVTTYPQRIIHHQRIVWLPILSG
jgi:hypothetical protein